MEIYNYINVILCRNVSSYLFLSISLSLSLSYFYSLPLFLFLSLSLSLFLYISFTLSLSSFLSQQGFSIKDRSVSPVTFDSVNISQSLLLVGNYIDELRLSLAVEMNRYISTPPKGFFHALTNILLVIIYIFTPPKGFFFAPTH